MLKLQLNEAEEFEGVLRISRTGYYAINQRKKLSSMSEESYLENFETKYIDTEVDSIEVKNFDKLDKPLSEVFQIKIIKDDAFTDKIRINPILFNRLERNPFRLKERKFPVDFGYPRKQTYTLNLVIPDGYTIAQLPKKVAISLPENGGLFIYKTVANDKFIRINVRLNISKSIFSNEEYFALKEFYKQIIIAENSQIILKKK